MCPVRSREMPTAKIVGRHAAFSGPSVQASSDESERGRLYRIEQRFKGSRTMRRKRYQLGLRDY
jgi:hypothetical protein